MGNKSIERICQSLLMRMALKIGDTSTDGINSITYHFTTIAIVNDKDIKINFNGYGTSTTIQKINFILRFFGYKEHFYTKKSLLRLIDVDGVDNAVRAGEFTFYKEL